MKKTLRTGILVALVALFVGSAGQSRADNLSVRLQIGATIETCADGAACDSAALAGIVTFSSTVGTVTIQTQGTGSGTPALPPLNMDLSYNVTQTAAAPASTVTISVSENNLSGTGVTWSALINGNQNVGYTTTFSSFVDPNNALFVNGSAVCSAGPVATAAVALSCSGPAGGFTDASFSLTEQIVITTLAGSGNASGDARLTPSKVPEPASMLLFGFGLVGLGIWGRKRFGK
jgi:hypothetical protein